jgi:non-heme chloroperoxidase
MSTLLTRDGCNLFYKDWSAGQPIVFSHGWPLSADAWDAQMMFFGEHGYRVIAHDRRGHGRSSQTWTGNDMNTYADDLAQLLDHLDVHDAVLVGHSTGGGEVTRYIGRHGNDRVQKVVLIGAIPPLMLRTEANPEGTPKNAFDELRKSTLANRPQFTRDLAIPFYGYNRKGAKASEGVIEAFFRIGMQAGLKGYYDCIEQFSETDFTQDLKAFSVPTLIVHGDDDQIVPIAAAGLKAAKLISGATLKVYKGAPHGLTVTHADQLHHDLLQFIEMGTERGETLRH